jgi:predicted metal-dependent peptidase
MKNAVVQAATGCKDAGHIPGGVKRMLKDLLNPMVDWRTLLANEIQGLFKTQHTWLRPSRRGDAEGLYLPSLDPECTIDISITIDTSGSISEDMLRDFLSEVYGIMGQYSDFKIKLWCFDTKIHNPQDFTADNMEDLLDYELAGFGGTMFEPNWEYMKEIDHVPGKFIMFTDGYPCDTWGDENYCDTLFIVHGGNGQWASKDVPEAPFGQTVPYTRKEENE